MTAPRFGQGMPPNDGWVARQIADIHRRITELAAARGLAASTIGSGGVNVSGGLVQITQDGAIAMLDQTTGRVVCYIGKALTVDGAHQMVFELYRDDGTPALTIGDFGTIPGHPHQQALAFFDRSANAVFADDTTSGVGISRPWLPIGLWDDGSYPTSTTTSASFVTLATLTGYQQHPRVGVQVLARASDGATSGSLQLVANGTTVLDTQALPLGGFQYVNFAVCTLPAAPFGTALVLTVQAKRTAGTGTVGLRGTIGVGIGS